MLLLATESTLVRGLAVPSCPQMQGRTGEKGRRAGRGRAGIGLTHLHTHQQSLPSTHDALGTVLGSGIMMVNTTWLRPLGPCRPQGLVGKQG